MATRSWRSRFASAGRWRRTPRRILGPVQLTSLGVRCIIGAGIFVTPAPRSKMPALRSRSAPSWPGSPASSPPTAPGSRRWSRLPAPRAYACDARRAARVDHRVGSGARVRRGAAVATAGQGRRPPAFRGDLLRWPWPRVCMTRTSGRSSRQAMIACPRSSSSRPAPSVLVIGIKSASSTSDGGDPGRRSLSSSRRMAT